jgi:tripartite-type tricarboxylate transporter receptor subunit TctC
MTSNQLLSRRNAVALVIFCIGIVCVPFPAFAQNSSQPSHPVELIIPWGEGGGADKLGRKVAGLLSKALQVQVNVTNSPGGTGNIGMAKLLKEPSDGRRLAIVTAETYALLAYLNPGWKPDDIIPLGIMNHQASALFVATNSPYKTWADFEKQARKNPGTLRVAISGLGSPDYITLNQFAEKGIKLVPVPFANPEERYAALTNNLADALYEQPGDVLSLIEKRFIRPVLIFNSARIPQFANVPTSKEAGYGPGLWQFRAIVIKAGTEPAQITTLSNALAQVAKTAEFKKFLETELSNESTFLSGKEATAFLHTELESMKHAVEKLPMHGQYINGGKEVEEYVPTF